MLEIYKRSGHDASNRTVVQSNDFEKLEARNKISLFRAKLIDKHTMIPPKRKKGNKKDR